MRRGGSRRGAPATQAPAPSAPREDPPWFNKDPDIAFVAVPDGITWESIRTWPQARWEVDVEWRRIEQTLNLLNTYGNLDLSPPFQRGHVWTDAQRSAWVEYVLQGGETGLSIVFVTDDWVSGEEARFLVILDGLQRLETVRRFMRGDVRIFPDAIRPNGYAVNEIGGVVRPYRLTLKVRVVEVACMADAIQTYLGFNGGGTPHTREELDRVRRLLEDEATPGAQEP